jgi:hypothetical protein
MPFGYLASPEILIECRSPRAGLRNGSSTFSHQHFIRKANTEADLRKKLVAHFNTLHTMTDATARWNDEGERSDEEQLHDTLCNLIRA